LLGGLTTAKRAAALVIGLAVVGAGVVLVGSASHVLGKSTLTVDDVAEALTCQCGCGLTVANCNHPNCSFAVPARKQIAEMIGKGMTKVQIIAFFRAKYGEKILSSPTMRGFDLLAWLMPYAMIGLGALAVLFAIGRWRRATPSLPAGPEAVAQRVPAADAKLKEQLEQQVREKL
jgi:cytochrome c-type biogenesis protein CcmH/NrfF